MRLRHLLASFFLFAPLCAQQVLRTTYGGQANGRTGDFVAGAGDVDGDQVPDLLVTSPNWGSGRVQVVSGATGSTRTILNPGSGNFGLRVLIGTPDMNLDGVRDIVIERGNDLVAYSGATLAVLWQTQAANFTYLFAAPVGDLDGDGRCDVGAMVVINGVEFLWTLRGSNGSQLQASGPLSDGTFSFTQLGDINGDGRPELVRGSPNGWIYVLQVSPPSNLLSFYSGVGLATYVEAANLAGDARNEIVAGVPGQVRVFQANNGALVRAMPGERDFTVIGDLNADGVPDVAVRTPASSLSIDGVDFRSGANGGLLAQWFGTPSFRCARVAAAGDVNGDGFGDLLLGDPDASLQPGITPLTGAWQLLSCKLLATMQQMPTSCAQGPFFPQLGITRPRLGYVATIEGRDAPAGTVGFLAFSPRPTAPTNLGVMGCDAWFDLSNGLLLHQPTSVNWTFQLPVPAAPQLAGYAFALQAFYAPTFSALGMDLSNGVWARLGF